MLDDYQKTIRNEESIDPPVSTNRRRKILVLFGTRPEAVKLAPVIERLKITDFQAVVVCSSQHTDLLAPFLKIFDLKIDYDLRVMTENQSPNQVAARVLSALDAILEKEKPETILVQGDTTTALAGAIAAFNRKIRIGHVEAGLRSGNSQSPFPEELNRRLISQLSTLHFCATEGNRMNLLAEGVSDQQIFVTGNTVVDALQTIVKTNRCSKQIERLIEETKNYKLILLTTHRRESFGETMASNLETLGDFVENRTDVCLVFPVHQNPNVRRATAEILANRERVFLLEALDYADFATLMKAAWLIVSDSGGVQEEAPSLGKPLLVLRENTERPEAIESGIAKLVGSDLKMLLNECYDDERWIKSVKRIKNPFGDGKAARRIVQILEREFADSNSANAAPRRTKAKSKSLVV